MLHNIKDDNSLTNACDIIRSGGIIIYPTDTIYGFGVDATNPKAIRQLNILKKRKQVYSIIVNSNNMLYKYANVTKSGQDAINKYFPGPFTMIFNRKESNLSDLIYLNFETIGIRIPDHEFPNKIVKYLDRPIVTTSVNIHNKKPLYDLKEIKNKFNKINIFYDENIRNKSSGSTIIDFSKKSKTILRKGDGNYIA
tara:strand:+ start:162 stop:749 length:588 start_codon:yes stop_codon:yes gene_type:complete